MRAATTEFVAHPSDAEVKNFDDRTGAGDALPRPHRDGALPAGQQDSITPLRITVRDLKASFDSLVGEQQSLGFDDSQGVTAELIAASRAVESIIHNELSWVADNDRDKLMMSLLTMRRYGIEYRLRHDDAVSSASSTRPSTSTRLFESVDGAPAMKAEARRAVQAYRSTFAQLVASTENIAPLVALIGHDTASVLPEADKIMAAARRNADTRCRGAGGVADADPAIRDLARSRGGAARARLQLAHRPLDHPAARGLAAAMKRLAAGDTSAGFPPPIPRRNRRNGAHRRGVPRQHDRARAACRRRRARPMPRANSAARRSRR